MDGDRCGNVAGGRRVITLTADFDAVPASGRCVCDERRVLEGAAGCSNQADGCDDLCKGNGGLWTAAMMVRHG